MVIPRFRSSGALSIAPYSRKFAYPFSACRLVIAAVSVVWEAGQSISMGLQRNRGEPCRDRRDRLCLFLSAIDSSISKTALPIFTWGFVRSKTVASPRMLAGSWPKTCCKGLVLCCLTASPVVRKKGRNDLAKAAILTQATNASRKGMSVERR